MTQESDRENLIRELRQNGVKHNPENIIRIVKLPNSTIVFLEIGDNESGLQHIIKEHSQNFISQGILVEEIPDLIIITLTTGKFIGYQGRKKTRIIYEVVFKGKTYYIAVTVSSNGYIVGANPRHYP